ncbi:hypothetical protein CY35_05G065000 [Sphagnum magellanicum]|nr:hypothetical protein CY35_05G065000 [Sphagnum magellanicum]
MLEVFPFAQIFFHMGASVLVVASGSLFSIKTPSVSRGTPLLGIGTLACGRRWCSRIVTLVLVRKMHSRLVGGVEYTSFTTTLSQSQLLNGENPSSGFGRLGLRRSKEMMLVMMMMMIKAEPNKQRGLRKTGELFNEHGGFFVEEEVEAAAAADDDDDDERRLDGSDERSGNLVSGFWFGPHPDDGWGYVNALFP